MGCIVAIGNDYIMTRDETVSDARGFDGSTEALAHPMQTTWLEGSDPCLAIVEAVAVATSREPLDLEPLYDEVDTDALTTLLRSPIPDSGANVQVSFRYEGCRVVVSGTGAIEIETT